MKYCAYVASNAHVAVMRSTHAGMMEYELEARFLFEIYKNGGCRRCAYTSICACGPNASVLHYGHAGAPNDRQLGEADIALLDMGSEYHGYVSDITCSFPVSGKFSSDQRGVYEGVLSAQIAVLENMRPGFSWVACHRAAERQILKALLGLGILRDPSASCSSTPQLRFHQPFSVFQLQLNSSDDGVLNSLIDAMVNVDLGAVFFPHGLGHLIGCDTHDVGGYLPGSPDRSTKPGVDKLRTSRCLEAGMILTNEPGCYFIDMLLDRALASPEQAIYINNDVLKRFRGFGGVRLEDVVLVTETGPANLTLCPRTCEEVESVMSGGQWPPALDAAPQLFRRWCTFSPSAPTVMTDIQLGV